MSQHTLRLALLLSLRQLDELDHLRRSSGLTRDQWIAELVLAALKPEPHLHRIKIRFIKGHQMANVGPVTLTTLGQTVTASVVGFDQFGNPFTGTIPTPTFTASDTAGAIATFDPTTGLVTAVANGIDSITATVDTTDANGNPVTLTDTETVTVAIPVVTPPTPILSSVKVAFA
jgi:hypothetical protein